MADGQRDSRKDTRVTDGMGGSAMSGPEVQASADDAQVDRILSVLDDLDDLPVSEHVDVYLDVHDRLSGELNPGRKLHQAGAHGAS